MKKDNLYRLIILTILFVLLLVTRNINQIFGSSIDWINQHVVFADYLRNLFYETGNLFPNFMPHLGLGENIYYIGYYGLYNPVILFSYLLPKVPMIIYFQFANIILYLISSMLFYKYLRGHFNEENSLIGTLLFSFSAPILFHFHKQVMFVNYMPALILSLIGIDKYFKNKKSWLFILGVFLMILTSYYYSVTGIFALIIYGIYVYLKKEKHFKLKEFIVEGLKFIVPIILAVLMSSILLLPTAYTLFSGRSEGVNEASLAYIAPDYKLVNFLYSDYTLGLTLISIISIISIIIMKNKKLIAEKFLAISIFIIGLFPVFSYILNGFLYARGKILIPFVPLFILVILIFIKNMDKLTKKEWKLIVPISFMLLLLAYFKYFENTKYDILMLIDFILLNIGLIAYFLKKNKKILIALTLIMAFSTCYYSNICEKYVLYQTINNSDNKALEELITATTNNDNTWYRFNNLVDTYNKMNVVYNDNYYTNSMYSSSMNSYYYNFYKNILEVNLPEDNGFIVNSGNNIIFESLMGVKYLASDYDLSKHYQKLVQKDNIRIYENANYLSLGYATSKIFDSKKLNTSSYKEKINLLTQAIGVKNSNNTISNEIIKEINLDLENFYTDKTYSIKEKINKEIVTNLDLGNNILILTFEVNGNKNCSSEKRYISINGIKEMISCDKWLYANHNYNFVYVITNTNKLNVEIEKGTYNIKNIKTYEFDYSMFLEYLESINRLENIKINDNVITGQIEVKEDGYFATTIPYDEGYRIYIDDKEVDKELINETFLGSRITKGLHNIKIVYKAPLFIEGSILSTFGILGTILIIVKEKSKKKRF